MGHYLMSRTNFQLTTHCIVMYKLCCKVKRYMEHQLTAKGHLPVQIVLLKCTVYFAMVKMLFKVEEVHTLMCSI